MTHSPDAPGPAVTLRPWHRADVLVLAVVAAAALASAGFLYCRFLPVHRSLWDSASHDRNAHYTFCLRMATDMRNGRVLTLLEDFNHGSGVWPPFQAVLASGVLLVGGPDDRLAVLPSLAGYVLAVVFGFLTARRAVPAGGNLAGFVAALFILVSPAYRAFATDVMLESLGAGLSLVVLYCYLVAVQGRPDGAAAGRWLGLALTALFLHKYNYWLLVVFALTAAGLVTYPRACWQVVRDAATAVDWRRWLRAQLRDPLAYLLAALVVAVAAVDVYGDRPLDLMGRTIFLYPPNMIITVAYIVFFLRLVLWWRRAGRQWADRLDGRVRQVVLWHLWPAAAWFLLPRHLAGFLWYVGPTNAPATEHSNMLAAVAAYSRWITEDYHLGLWSAAAAGVLLLVGLLAWRWVRPGGRVVLCFVLIAAALTVMHPSRKARHVHSWLVGVWAAAGIGATALTHGRLTARWPQARPWLAGAAAAGLALAQAPGAVETAHAQEGGPHVQIPSVLELTDYYLPEMDQAHQAGVLADAPVRFLAEWTFLQRNGRLDRLENKWLGYASRGGDERQAFETWLRTSRTDVLIVLERAPGTYAGWEDGEERVRFGLVRDLLEQQKVFRKEKGRDFPDLSCTVSVWKRTTEPAGP